jgi:hypothetical protein
MSNATTMSRITIFTQPDRAQHFLVFGSEIWAWNHHTI